MRKPKEINNEEFWDIHLLELHLKKFGIDIDELRVQLNLPLYTRLGRDTYKRYLQNMLDKEMYDRDLWNDRLQWEGEFDE